MRLESVKLGGCDIHLLPVIKGLVSESDKVRQAFDYAKPEVVAISISKEELEGLRNLPDDFEPELSRYEEIYANGLGRFGEVAAPPPCYVAALELADHRGIPLIAVDMDETSYTELYVMAVSGGTLFRHSTRTWLLKRRRFSTESAEEFVKAWDRAVNGLEGFRKIEDTRAKTIARGIIKACDGAHKRVLAVVELERAQEVLEIIREKLEKE
jgi:hypothetical protein